MTLETLKCFKINFINGNPGKSYGSRGWHYSVLSCSSEVKSLGVTIYNQVKFENHIEKTSVRKYLLNVKSKPNISSA